ncbi:MAG: histidinol-phosphatase HisJ family protein [Clostridiales bacterium]|nr:histidinol-phosphatase HisJ family protein [Clostridiales bacterium]
MNGKVKIKPGGGKMFREDYHLHTNASSDSDASPESMIERSIQLGLKEIALTDHVDFDDRYTYPDYNEYIPKFIELQEKYSKDIKIMLGVEVGLDNRVKDEVNEFTKSAPFDFIIGSSHSVAKYDLYFDQKEYFSLFKNKREAYSFYFTELIENIKTCKTFCVYGHMDFVNRYGTYEDNSLSYFDYSDLVDTALKLLIEKGKGIEINTSGFRYGLGQTHPSFDFVKRYKELGGEIITIGSDAHRPEDVGKNFDVAYDMLERVGFKYVTAFRYQKPVFKKFN